MSEGGQIPISVLVVIVIYVLVGEFLKSHKIHIIHETSFGIISGMIVGGLFKIVNTMKYHSLVIFFIVLFMIINILSNMKFRLDPNMFFQLLLPLIIFSGGYNLKKKKFLHNFKYIVLFGFISTLLNFLIQSSLTYGLNQTGIIQVQSNDGNVGLSVQQILLFSATICATDSVAALTLISSDQYPQLFSVVFGEGMVNDAVSIILFKAVTEMLDSPNSHFEWYTPFDLIYQFLKNCILSLMVGIAIGLISTLAFKRFRYLNHSTTSETVFAFLMAYFCYSLCELFQLSGVIGLLMCGLVMSHYQTYNISNLAKVTTRVTFESMSLVAESFIYVYLGFSFWNQTVYYDADEDKLIPLDVNYGFTACQFVIVMVSRFFSIFLVYWGTLLIQGQQGWKLLKSELYIQTYSGIIRGSVAFALIETLPLDYEDKTTLNQTNIVQSTVYFIVVFSTIIFGTSMPYFINYQLKNQMKDSNKELSSDQNELNQSPSKELEEKLNKQISSETESESPTLPKKQSEAQRIIKYLDDNYFKRWFIFDYEGRKKQILELKRDIKTRNLQEIYDEATSESNDEDTTRFRIEIDESEKQQITVDPSEQLYHEWLPILQ